jgi:hypothetical protein
MPFIKVQLKPGVNRDQTNYTNEGGWYECDKIRFRSGMPQKIGGWLKAIPTALIGTCRQMFGWFTTFSDNFLALGTNVKVYIDAGGTLNDITPIRETTAPGAITFSAVTIAPFSSTITVTDPVHGCVVGSYVTYSGAVSLGGNITAAVLNQEYEVVSVISSSQYTITARNTSGVTVTSNASDTGNGGVLTVGRYQINPGAAGGTYGYGWGTGTWGRGGWGTPSTVPFINPQTDWIFANFNNDLLMNRRENSKGPIYIWQRGILSTPGVALATRAVLLSSIAGASDVPAEVGIILVSQNDKHLLAFGATEYAGATYNPLLIRWANQDEPENWTPLVTNSAGFLQVSRGSRIVSVIPTRQEILVFTDTTLNSLQFLGTTDVFGIQELSDNISVASVRSVTMASNVVYWMGIDKFYAYNGRVEALPCTLRNHVFQNLNYDQLDQVICGTNEGWNEVWWFYPTTNSSTNDAYVVYNHIDKIWYYGAINRTAWIDNPLRQYPQAVGGQFLYNHEEGINDDVLPMNAYIRSSDFDLAEGENYMLLRRLIPDVQFEGSTAATPAVDITLYPRNYPGTASFNGAVNTRPIIETSANIYTEQVFIRSRARQMAFQIASDELGVQWQLGSPRIDARPDGKQ